MSMGKIPVLFVFFNRPETTGRSFESIRKYKPARLYLASDGPRRDRDGESAVVENLRKEILSRIDWD